MSNHDRMTLFDLKEKAKWSAHPEEKKAAIEELSNQGEDAMSELQEIMRITAYEDIKNACAEAIMSIQTRNKEEVVKINETSPPSYSPSSPPPTTHDSNSTTDLSTTAAKSQKKEGEKLENEPRARERRKSD
jgi:hypothetical protein